jgi:hypothetical protein
MALWIDYFTPKSTCMEDLTLENAIRFASLSIPGLIIPRILGELQGILITKCLTFNTRYSH